MAKEGTFRWATHICLHDKKALIRRASWKSDVHGQVIIGIDRFWVYGPDSLGAIDWFSLSEEDKLADDWEVYGKTFNLGDL